MKNLYCIEQFSEQRCIEFFFIRLYSLQPARQVGLIRSRLGVLGGSIVSAAIAGFSLIASVSLYFVGKHNDRIAQERNDARRISVWGVASSANGYCGVLIGNGCPYPAEYFSLTQDGNGQKLRVNILPPCTWFSQKMKTTVWKTVSRLSRMNQRYRVMPLKKKTRGSL